MSKTEQCQHPPEPTGYREWHAWADRMARTHRQVWCPHCGLWAIWLPKGLRVTSDVAPGDVEPADALPPRAASV